MHLTYKTHVPHDDVLAHIRDTFDAPKYWSIVHEVGDAEEESATPYAHTHAAFIWETKQQKQGNVFEFGTG